MVTLMNKTQKQLFRAALEEVHKRGAAFPTAEVRIKRALAAVGQTTEVPVEIDTQEAYTIDAEIERKLRTPAWRGIAFDAGIVAGVLTVAAAAAYLGKEAIENWT